MKKMEKAIVVSQVNVAQDTYSLHLNAPHIAKTAQAGQFVEMYINDGAMILPRPISICDADGDVVRFVYQVKGKGTKWLSALTAGDALRITGPLGVGFDLGLGGADAAAVAGGGIGIPPLLLLCKRLQAENANRAITAFLGYRGDVFLVKDFKKAGVTVKIATDDGSLGFHGNVAQLLEHERVPFGALYTCGPTPMLQSVAAYAEKRQMPCQVSMEEKMGCGVGACMSCVVKMKSAGSSTSAGDWTYKRVCADGPVFNAAEVLWHG